MAERSLRRILIVDDDQKIARLVRSYLSGPGIGYRGCRAVTSVPNQATA